MEPTHEDPMDMTPTASAAMAPPGHSSPEIDATGPLGNGNYGEPTHVQNGATGNGMSAAAATSSQQPKVVQTAFIHKLYRYITWALTDGLAADAELVCWRTRL